MRSLRRFLQLVADDARATRTYFAALFDVWRRSRRRKADRKALALAYRNLGDTAESTPAAEERRSFGSVQENRARVEELIETCEARREEEDEARVRLDERTEVRRRELDELKSRASRRAALHRQARDERDDLARRLVPPAA